MTRDERAAQTRERILRAAVKLFAAKGYEGVSVDELVARAHVNKRMVYHYFGSKSGLYSAVLERVYAGLAEEEAAIFQGNPDVEEALERIIRGYFDFLCKHPEFVALLLWENLQGGKHLQTLRLEISKEPILRSLEAVIEKGVRSGRMRRGIDSRHMLINLIGLCLVYFSNRHTLSQTVGIDLEDPGVLEKGISHAIAMAKRGYLKN